MNLKSFFFLTISLILFGCSKDDEPSQNETNKSIPKVTINSNGTTSTGVTFSQIDATTFYLDYIKYEIVDSHLEIIGYDPEEIKSKVIPYGIVGLNGSTYNTRIVSLGAFEDCPKMKEIILPNTITTIEESAFRCRSLTNIVLPASLLEIEAGAFNYSSKLESIIIPDGITSIPYVMCLDCHNLKKVVLPKNIKTIAPGAFYNCDALTDIYVSGKPECDGPESFTPGYYPPVFSQYNATIHTTKENFEWIKQAKIWSNFKNIVADYNP